MFSCYFKALLLNFIQVISIGIIAEFIFFLPPQISAQESLPQISFSTEWLKLLHYLPHGKGFQSELDGPGFFFSPQGKNNPQEELKASLAALSNPNPPLITAFKIHPQCAFPERFRFLQEKGLLSVPPVACPILKQFTDRFKNPQGVTLVFSSSYPNNPASMFGHTFLRIRSAQKNPLLDTGVNFAAAPPKNDQMLAFIFKGIFGGYRGIWSTQPYFEKVNEYIHSESRDLWEYDLSLSPQETLRLIHHLWELEINSYFDYYFFDKNCSYQILRAMEAIRPEWNFSAHHIYVIPGDTVRRVFHWPQAVIESRFRPSLVHQLQIHYQQLNPPEKNHVLELLSNDSKNKDVDTQPHEQNKITYSSRELDTALTALLYRKAKKKKDWSTDDQKQENHLLKLRSSLAVSAPQFEPPPPSFLRTRPEWGHDSYSFHATGGVTLLEDRHQQPLEFTRLKIRSAYHDLMGQDEGFSPFSEIEFPWLEVQWSRTQFQLNELGLFSSTSLFPLNPFDHRMSWRIKWAFERDKTEICSHCFLGTVELGGGVTLGSDKYRVYSLLLGKNSVHHQLWRGFKTQPGIELGWIWNPFTPYKIRLTSRHLWSWPVPPDTPLTPENQLRLDHSFTVSRNQQIRQSSLFLFNRFTHSSSSIYRAQQQFEFWLEWIQYFY